MDTATPETAGSFRGFSPDTFAYLDALAFNNERAWFEAHRSDYERLVREPALALIRDMERVVKGISPHYVAEAKKVGGSLMRAYRDTRFGADKTPYKTNVGIQFRHEAHRDVHAPGFYVHLATDGCFVGSGCWRPEPDDLARIRARISERPKDYARAVEKGAIAGMVPAGDSLIRVPRGFSPEHPLAADIKRKDFLLSRDLDSDLYLNAALIDLLAVQFAATAPYMAFLCAAVGARF